MTAITQEFLDEFVKLKLEVDEKEKKLKEMKQILGDNAEQEEYEVGERKVQVQKKRMTKLRDDISVDEIEVLYPSAIEKKIKASELLKYADAGEYIYFEESRAIKVI